MIDYAFDVAIEKHKHDDNDFIYNALKRDKKMWETIRTCGLEMYGMSYEDFCKQCEKKRNIIFVSDDNLADYNKAVKIMRIINED